MYTAAMLRIPKKRCGIGEASYTRVLTRTEKRSRDIPTEHLYYHDTDRDRFIRAILEFS